MELVARAGLLHARGRLDHAVDATRARRDAPERLGAQLDRIEEHLLGRRLPLGEGLLAHGGADQLAIAKGGTGGGGGNEGRTDHAGATVFYRA
ncbi:hypothetical protein D3C72_1777220 [compost metagenome]